MKAVVTESFARISRMLTQRAFASLGMGRLAARLPRPPTHFRPIATQLGNFSSLCTDRADIISQCLFWFGRFDPWVAQVASIAATSGSAVIDVGANLGAVTIPLARAVGPTGVVLSFEPDQINFGRLTENIAANQLSNVQSHRCAVSTAARVQIVRPQSGEPGHLRTAPADGDLANSVKGVSLDSICEQLVAARQQPVTLCKIDVEGAEADVLASGRASLATKLIEAVLFESHDPVVAGQPLADLFLAYGYKMYRIHKSRHGAFLVGMGSNLGRGVTTCDYLAVLPETSVACRVSRMIVT
ncbi:MAG: FkbM family methyltransferase [Planctomycetota bacterium]|nr:FkbM family methyltransferase [Planctomycetota bacterium]